MRAREVAQSGRALGWGSSGRRFKSCLPDMEARLVRQPGFFVEGRHGTRKPPCRVWLRTLPTRHSPIPMADLPSGSGPRFEKDLHDIRQARGVSLTEVQQETRIPADVLERFENGRLMGDQSFNEVYLKALVRAYAEAVSVAPAEAVGAYEATKSGAYRGELRHHLGEEAVPFSAPAEADPQDVASAPPPVQKPRQRATDAAAPPAVTALRQAKEPSPAEAPRKPDQKVRVQSREAVTSSTSSIDSSWGLIIGGTLIGVLVIAGVLWLLLRDDTPQPVERPGTVVTAPEEVAEEAAPDDEVAPAPATDAPQLEIPIRVTVIAQDGALTGFRVTEEPDVRRPYWLEQGEEQTFESQTEVILWGAETGIPSAARVRLQGFTWNPETGSVLRIDRERGQALLDSLHQVQTAAGP